MIVWHKFHMVDGFIPPLDTPYILPCDKGIQILYDGEFCVIENIGVQEFVEVLKSFDDQPSFKTDFKTTVERVVNHLILPQKTRNYLGKTRLGVLSSTENTH